MSQKWRGHIGLISPTYRGKVFAFWYQTLPRGVECSTTTIGFATGDKQTFGADKSFRRAEEIASELCAVGCEILTIPGSPPFILQGPEYEHSWRRQLENKQGVPVVTGMAPHAVAARAMGIKRMALATYFGDELNNGITTYFSAQGVESEIIPGLSFTGQGEGLYTTPMRALDWVSDEEVYRHCKRGIRKLKGKVDGLYINGGGWDAAPAIEPLEKDLGIPVIWALAAEMWLTYSLLEVGDPILGYGTILSDAKLRHSEEVARWET